MRKLILNSFVFFLMISGLNFAQNNKVIVGADLLLSDEFSLIQNKNIAIVTNHTGVLSNGTHLIDTLLNKASVTIKSLFGPEHGIRGNAPDGKSINDSILKNIPIYSLYGKVRKPTADMLKDVDVIIFDIQDIGSRYYTFISTMFYCIEAAADYNIPIVILDRPNPINGITVDGPLRKDEYKSFVAIAPIPIVHGMTVGELATLFNDERMISSEKKAKLTVVKIKNWERKFYYDDCSLTWVKPSPNMPTLETALLYQGLCLIEGINVSEGRGTYKPFIQIGAPFIKPNVLIKELKVYKYSGIEFIPIEFTPISIDSMSKFPKYENELCKGIEFRITDRNDFKSLRFGIDLLFVLKKLYPDKFQLRNNWLDKLYGSSDLTEKLVKFESSESLFKLWDDSLISFKLLREKYLLY
ncbi:MAG: DUF1343 domain-containing protein [Bacteroidetes bacterium]|nr:DUF1343 domain-containing protein [Bacteroidota bacterium]